MPYMMVKVCQDLYQELGLCPTMELVRSISERSIKFVPLSDKSVFDNYPLLTSLGVFGNRVQESGNSNSSELIEQVSSDDVTRSDELCEGAASHNSPSEGGDASEKIVSEECTDLNQPVEDEVSVTEGDVSNPGSSVDEEMAAIDKADSSVQKDNPTTCSSPLTIFKYFTSASELSSSVLNIEVDEVRCIELDSRGKVSSVSLTAPPPELSNSARQLFSYAPDAHSPRNTPIRCEALAPSSGTPIRCEALGPSSGTTIRCEAPAPSSDTPIKSEASSNKCSSDVSSSRHSKDKRIEYPRRCENCSSVYKHCSSFTRHKKSCEEVKKRRLMRGAASKSETSQSDDEPMQKKANTTTAHPRVCDRCGLIFAESRAFRYHLTKCETYRQIQPISSNTERIILVPGAVSSNIDLGMSREAKYIPLKAGSESRRFFIRKKAPTDSD